uniref:G_PROTEIN_RECEP_F1_2 domain-containing protein n=1 Tax=Caenorhabditis tropicalis TaxID=1561998 RepID=A0A1I7V067_9PELO
MKIAREKISATHSVSQLRNPSEPLKSDHTTRFIALMTMTFMISDGPIGVVYVIQGFLIHQKFFESLTLISMCISILTIFMTFNASIHCIISLTLSSPYRETVKSLFIRQKVNPSTTARISGSALSRNGLQAI